MSHEPASLFSRIWAAFKRALLGKSMNRFSGSDEYWDRVVAAQLGWPQKQSPEVESGSFPEASQAVRPAGELS
jgi:hypothetical protein